MAERTRETVDEAIHRLASEAKRKGVQIFLYPRTGEYYATSTSSPDELHRVTLISCDCPAFTRHQRRTHHAALLAELDELPPFPPTPISSAELRDLLSWPGPRVMLTRGRVKLTYLDEDESTR
ncbi:MAG: hypothetical protein ACJ789_12765 [Thermomicrobiales bacterium]